MAKERFNLKNELTDTRFPYIDYTNLLIDPTLSIIQWIAEYLGTIWGWTGLHKVIGIGASQLSLLC